MATIFQWSDPPLEERLRSEVNLDESLALLQRFSKLVRESGSQDERAAARYVTDRLDHFGISYRVHEPELFLSVPQRARLVVRTPDGTRELRAKTPAFSAATGNTPVAGNLAYVPTLQPVDVLDVFTEEPDMDLETFSPEQVALVDGFPMPTRVHALSRMGVPGVICIAPGTYIHEGICTPIWGLPDLGNYGEQPQVPVIAISQPDGRWLIEQLQQGDVQVEIQTWLSEGWVPCPLVEAVIPGTTDPERFVLFHGHIDSWHVGIGDNATGDATLLEIARVLHGNRDQLHRSVRICWWPGHSTGRYAGSTWYADAFAVDIARHCVAHINCDSPGCRWATDFRDVTCMPEAEGVAAAVIRDAAGLEAHFEWPVRAGDISFNNLGVSTFFMLSSTIPPDVLEEKGCYAVGGCGGNIEWHTEDDTLDIMDPEILLRDIRVYLTAVLRMANAPVVPLDFTHALATFQGHMETYDRAAAGRVSFARAYEVLEGARQALESLYSHGARLVERGSTAADPQLAPLNEAVLGIGRQLVSLAFSREGRFRHDPALPIPPIPELSPALALAELPDDSHLGHVTRTDVIRGLNRIAWALAEVVREAETAVGGVS